MSCTETIKGLGEIALRVDDLETMQKFYEEVIGLKLMKRFPQSVFLKSHKDTVDTLRYWLCLIVRRHQTILA